MLVWRLNKILYKDGNYIEFKYTDVDRDSRIDEILYTGNAAMGLTPYNKIKFNYSIRTDINKTYEAGQSVVGKYLLDNITVTAESAAAFKVYEFKYGHNNISSYLKEVVEKGSNGTALNSTIFKYGDEPTSFSTGSTSAGAGSSVDMFSGDFDGDGYSDILAAEFAYYTENGVTVKYHTGFKIYKRTATSSTIGLAYTVTFPANEKWQVVNKVNTPKQDMFFTADFTGDGRDDIMINKLGYTSTGGFQVDLFRLYTSTSSGGSTCTFNVSDFNPPTISGGGCNGTYNRFAAHLGDGQYFFPGDFNGDGAMDFLTVLSGGSGYKAFLSFPRTNEFF